MIQVVTLELDWTQLHQNVRKHGRKLCLTHLVRPVSTNTYGLQLITRGHIHHTNTAKEQLMDIVFQICYNLLNPIIYTH